jgi:hypothetical protein
MPSPYTCPTCGQPMTLIENEEWTEGPLPAFPAPIADLYRCDVHGLWRRTLRDGTFSSVSPEPEP